MQIAEVQVSFKPRIKAKERTTIKNSKDAYQTFLDKWDRGLVDYQEEFKVMLLNSANKVLGIFDLSKGAMDSVQVDLKILFATVLRASATKIILAHNHPSGTLKPSTSDRELTRKAVKIGQLLDIEVCDHLIMTAEGYYSFADDGYI